MSVVECEELRSWMERKSPFYLLNCMKCHTHVCERIPGANDFALEEIFSLQDLVQTLGRLGIRKDAHWVVCYQMAGLDAASEVWWLLQALGRDNSAVLSGGLTEWKRLNYPTTMNVPTPTPVLPLYDSGYEQMPQRYKLDSEIQEMQRSTGFSVQLIDTQGTFRGSTPFDPMLGVRSGGKLESPSSMEALLERCGIDLSEGTATIVIGTLASVALLQLASVGKRNIAVGLVDRSQEERQELAGALEINNEDFYSVLEVNQAPSQYLSVVETIYYDAMGGGSQRYSNAHNSEAWRGHSKGLSYCSDQFSRLSNKGKLLADTDSQRPKGRLKLGKEDRCAHCGLL